jgi:hypothetical protein
MMRATLLFAILGLTCLAGYAQRVKRDSTELSPDSVYLKGGRKVVSIESYAKRFDPRKALFYAAILPGAGQAYNKKYWKIPLVYGGFLGLLAVVNFYNDGEIQYTNKLFYAINHPNEFAYPNTQITYGSLIPQYRTIVNLARRQRDYFVILTGFFYILQMVDAHVDAHLKEFDVNPRLHVRLEPLASPAQGVGMGLVVRF